MIQFIKSLGYVATEMSFVLLVSFSLMRIAAFVLWTERVFD